MEILQDTSDNKVQSSNRFTASLVAFFIAFPLLIITLYRTPSIIPNNITTSSISLGEQVHNISDDHNNIGGGVGMYNNTVSEVGEKFQNVTAAGPEGIATSTTSKNIMSSEGGSKNVSANEGIASTSKNIMSIDEGSKNDSSHTSSTEDLAQHVAIPDVEDKLIHGLLASGFDEASCISRLQSHLYRKASPHIPSPYLISKLRNYEKIHRRCGPNTRAYRRSVKKIFKKNGASTSSVSCKYAVWTPNNGLGNQMLSLTATFLYSILTDRVLLGKIKEDKKGLFCEPFLNSTWILPENSPFWNVGEVETYESMLEKNKANSTIEEHLPPSVLFLNLAHTRDDAEKFFHCDHSQDLLSKVPLLIFKSDQYFVPSIFMTPFFIEETSKMFPEKDTVFHHLGRYLFHPSNDAWRLISKFYQENLAKADEKLGLQIRLFHGATVSKQAVTEVILSCTIKNNLLPEVISTQNSSSGKNLKNNVKAVVVASLYQEIGENLRAMYLNKPTITGESIEVYQASHEEHEEFNDHNHYLKAWTDIYLLSLSDVLVTSTMSTFGYVAQSLGNMRPWIIHQLMSNHSSDVPLCMQDFSMDPCFHFAPKHYCNGDPIEDFSSFLYLRKCKDIRNGVKLVQDSI